MQPVSYARHQFPAEIIRHATWLYLRFTLSYRDVEELLAERGIETSYETVRRWVLKFGPMFARTCAGCGQDQRASGTWTRWWWRSRAGACTCGEQSTVRTLFAARRAETRPPNPRPRNSAGQTLALRGYPALVERGLKAS
jgi:transposase-like protein